LDAEELSVMRKILCRLLAVVLFFHLPSLLVAQSVSGDYTDPFLMEGFDNNDNGWPILTNRDNFFIIQKGEYILERKNAESQFAIFSSPSELLNSYSLTVSLRIDNSTGKGYAGILFMVQSSGQGAFIVELSEGKKYRIKQLTGANYQLLTGEVSGEGWVKHSAIKAKEYNVIQARVNVNKADIYINSTYITTITDPAYKPGKAGLIAGPLTKARVDYYHVHTEKKKESSQGNKPAAGDSLRQMSSILNDHKAQIAALRRINDSLSTENSRLKEKLAEISSLVPPAPALQDSTATPKH
jgi:hypothetical protein